MQRTSIPLPHLTAIMLALAGACGAARSFTSSEIAGRWETAAPVYDERNKVYGSHVLELHGDRWTLNFTASTDAAGQQRLFSLRVGPSRYTLGAPLPGVAGAREADFERGSLHLTAHAASMAEMFGAARCGSSPWAIGTEQDITAAGCTFIPSRAACPQERDIVTFDGRSLALGDRGGDMCALPRPATASRASLARKPVFAMIQAKVNDPAAFFGQYVPGHVPSMQPYGGRFTLTLRAQQALVDPKLQGTLPGQMFVVQEWPSMLAFDAWWNSPEYAPWSALRARAAEVQVTLTTAVGK